MRYRPHELAAVAMAYVALAAAPRSAYADESAESLFEEGRDLLRRGSIGQACDKLAASVQMFEARGVAKLTVAAMLNHADCREQNKQLATAWSMFLTTATLAQNNNLLAVATEARKRAGLLQPRISTLTIVVADANRIDGLAIARSGVSIETALWNQGIPLDGGIYEVTATAPGITEWSATVEVPAENGRATIEIPRLKQLSDLADTIAPPLASQPEPSTSEKRAERKLTYLHWSGIAVASVGAVALTGGIVFARKTMAINDEAAAWETFRPARFAEGERAERNSLVALSAGSVCVLAGGVLFYLGHRSVAHANEARVTFAPVVSSDGAAVVAAGRF